MPRKQWSKLRSAAVAAAHNPSAHVSHPNNELTQDISSSTNVLGEMTVSKRNSRNEKTNEKKRYSQPQQQERKSQEEDSIQTTSEDASSTQKRSRIETSSDSTQYNNVTRSTVKFSLVESMQLRTPPKMKRHKRDSHPAGSDSSSPVINISNANNDPNEVHNVSRTEAELLQQHGPLTQLNNLYLPHDENNHDSSSTTTVEDQTERKDVDEVEDIIQRRREELLQISPGNLALYTRLAECGIDAIDRPFVTCAVKRAQIVVAEWASSFI